MSINMVRKTTYSAPEAELIIVKFEDNFLQSRFDKDNNTETIIEDDDEDI